MDVERFSALAGIGAVVVASLYVVARSGQSWSPVNRVQPAGHDQRPLPMIGDTGASGHFVSESTIRAMAEREEQMDTIHTDNAGEFMSRMGRRGRNRRRPHYR